MPVPSIFFPDSRRLYWSGMAACCCHSLVLFSWFLLRSEEVRFSLMLLPRIDRSVEPWNNIVVDLWCSQGGLTPELRRLLHR